MIVLGLDISYTRTGIALVEHENQTYTLRAALALRFPDSPTRLLDAYRGISDQVGELLRLSNRRPDLAVIEKPIISPNPATFKTSLMLAKLQAVFDIFLHIQGIDILRVGPTKLKKDITGEGTATKLAVALEVRRRSGIDLVEDVKKGGDLSDAAALALWGLLTKA